MKYPTPHQLHLIDTIRTQVRKLPRNNVGRIYPSGLKLMIVKVLAKRGGKFSTADLAKYINVSASTLYRWENQYYYSSGKRVWADAGNITRR